MIYVLAGVNGAGKSSIGGEAIRGQGYDWYNPDELARVMQHNFPGKSKEEINSEVWLEGLSRLKEAIHKKTHFTFETTLGGKTITDTLLDAIVTGVPVSIWYCGLSSVELHVERVAARVERGGHDIPEDLIRSRYKTSMLNLCRLSPGLKQLAVYDNSCPLDDHGRPNIRRLIHVVDNRIVVLEKNMPSWAKPIAALSLRNIKRGR